MNTGTPTLPDVMLARHDVELTFLLEYLRWYQEVHGPDAIEMGHFSASHYLCRVGEPLMCNVYETPGVDIVWSDPRYQEIRGRDVDRAEVLSHITNKSNTSYRQLAARFGTERVSDRGWITAEHLTTFTFDLVDVSTAGDATAADRLVAWYQEHELGRLAALDGFMSARLCRRAGRLHPDTPSTEPDWVVLCEWDDRGAARASLDDDDRETRHRRDVGVGLDRMAVHLLELVHRVHPARSRTRSRTRSR